MRHLIGRLAAGALLLAASSDLHAQCTRPAAARADSARRYVDALVRRDRLMAFGATVADRCGSVVFSAVRGTAAAEFGVPATAATPFTLYSSSKIMTVAVTLMLVQEGKLSLDQPIGELLPGLPPSWRPIPLVRLLSHSAGLKDGLGLPPDLDADSVRTRLEAAGFAYPPGTASRYGQTGFNLVRRILMRAEGKSFPELMAARLFRPLRMTSTYYGGAQAIIPGRATPYELDAAGELRRRHFEHSADGWAAAGLNSSVDDLGRFIAAVLSGRLVRPELLARMWERVPLADGRPGQFTAGLDPAGREGHRSSGFEGGGGATQRFYFDDGLAVAVVSNGPRQRFNPEAVAFEIAGIFDDDVRPAGSIVASRIFDLASAGDEAGALRLLADQERKGAEEGLEPALNALGYRLLGQGKRELAVSAFRANTRLYPASSNAFDSLGEALAAASKREEAIAAFERAVQLDPQNGNSADWLKRLRR
jgi:CubicO group peptidase (beta-lactamase class C family)